MSLAEELQKLEDLHRRGALNDEEFARAKAATLARFGAGGEQPPAAEIREQLAEIAREQDVARIDRAWERERERYLLTRTEGGAVVNGRRVGGYPVRYIPTKAGSVAGGVLAAAFGVVWMMFAGSIGGGAFALFGLVFIAFGVGCAIYSYSKAGEYERAERAYRRRRALARGGEQDETTRFLDGLDKSG